MSRRLQYKFVYGVRPHRGGEPDTRVVVFCSDFANIETGEPVKFAYSSTPMTDKGKSFPWSNKVGREIAKGRFLSGKTLEFTPEPGPDLNTKSKLSQELMIEAVVRQNPGFADYEWFKGPVTSKCTWTFSGGELKNRLQRKNVVVEAGLTIIGSDHC